MNQKQKRILGALFVSVVVTLVIASCLVAIFPNRWTVVGERHARVQCEEWITRQSTTGIVRFLEDTNEDSDRGEHHYTISGIVEATSADGVTRRFRYTCRLHAEIVGIWYKWVLDGGMEYNAPDAS